jgi:hypothetical protein
MGTSAIRNAGLFIPWSVARAGQVANRFSEIEEHLKDVHVPSPIKVPTSATPASHARFVSHLRHLVWTLTDNLRKQALSQLCALCSPDRRKESANLCYRDVTTGMRHWRSALRLLNSAIGGSKLSLSLGARDGTGFYRFHCPGFDRRRTVGRPGHVSHPATLRGICQE